MLNTLLIFLGAGIGGVLRFYFSNTVPLFLSRDFPYGTLFVNVSGSFFMGLFIVIIFSRFHEISQPLRSLLLIGLLGGYTTFSAFSVETIYLLEEGKWLYSFMNIFLSVFLCLSATWLGLLIARQILKFQL